MTFARSNACSTSARSSNKGSIRPSRPISFTLVSPSERLLFHDPEVRLQLPTHPHGDQPIWYEGINLDNHLKLAFRPAPVSHWSKLPDSLVSFKVIGLQIDYQSPARQRPGFTDKSTFSLQERMLDSKIRRGDAMLNRYAGNFHLYIKELGPMTIVGQNSLDDL